MWVFRRIAEERTAILIVLAIYIVLWVVIYNNIPNCFVFETHCSTNAGRSLIPLFGFLETGRLGTTSAGIPFTIYPMGYSVVFWVFGIHPNSLHPFDLVIPFQATLLFAIGLMVYAVAKEVWGRFGMVALFLVIFNPNALFVAAQPREDTLFAFFAGIAITAAISFRRSEDWRAAIVCGIALGISANIRPIGHYLIYVLPGLFLVFGLFSSRVGAALAGMRMGAIGTAAGWLLVVPWMLHIYAAGEGFSLTDNVGKFSWANDFRAMLADTENRRPTWKHSIIGIQDDRSRKAELNSILSRIDPGLASSVPGWDEMTEQRRFKYRYQEVMTYLDDFEVRTYIVSALPNLRHTFASGGEGEFFKALGLHQSLNEWRVQNPIPFISVKVTFMGFSLILKLVALLGLYYLIKTNQIDLAIFFVGAILYFAVVHLYHGSPRYRLPIEPIFIFMAICGLQWIADKISVKSKRGQSSLRID